MDEAVIYNYLKISVIFFFGDSIKNGGEVEENENVRYNLVFNRANGTRSSHHRTSVSFAVAIISGSDTGFTSLWKVKYRQGACLYPGL